MDDAKTMTYEEKAARLDEVVTCLESRETPIDNLVDFVKEGTQLIHEMSETLKQIEDKVADGIKELEDSQDLPEPK